MCSNLVNSSSMSSEVGSFSYETTSNVNQLPAKENTTFNRPSNLITLTPSVAELAQPDTQPTIISSNLQKNSKNNISQIASPTKNVATPFDKANMNEIHGVRNPKTNWCSQYCFCYDNKWRSASKSANCINTFTRFGWVLQAHAAIAVEAI